MSEPLNIYVGYDPREQIAFDVCCDSIRRSTRAPVRITPLVLKNLEACGLAQRPYRIFRHSIWDVISDAPQATEFANTRFLTPILAQTGLALFMDCDMLVCDDIAELFALADDRYAVSVVKHNHKPDSDTKMDNCVQTAYARKNWSSVVLWNCDHPSNKSLTLDSVNSWPGRELHAFRWLDDSEIGELPMRWNWLVDVEPEPEKIGIAHYTLGGPWFENWKGSDSDKLWTSYKNAHFAER